MSTHLLLLIVGLGVGAAYAGLAIGVVFTFRGTGVINLALGASAAWGAYVYDELRETGDYLLPVVGDLRLHVTDDVNTGLAVMAGVASSGMIGLLAHLLVFRPLRGAPALARVVASVGLMIVIQALIVLQFGAAPRTVPAVLPHENLRMAGLTFSRDRLFLAGAAIAVAVGLAAYSRFTRTGVATRAAAENETAAALMGYSAERLAALAWVVASGACALIVILVAPSTGLNPSNFTLFIVPALAVALVGRLQSIGVSCAAGLALGAVQSELTLLSGRDWWPSWASVGVAETVPFVVVLIALFVVGDRLPTRGTARLAQLPDAVRPANRPVLVGAFALAGFGVLVVTDGSYRFGVVTSMIVAVLALSFVLLTGLVGQISLAQAAFAGVSGFALSKLEHNVGVPFPISMLTASTIAAACGVLIGLPALRIRGTQLAVATLAAATALEQFVFRNPQLSSMAGNPISDPQLFGIDLAVRRGTDLARLPFATMVLVVLVAVAVVVGNLARSETGRIFLAVRSNEHAAAAAGINVAAVKVLAFGLSSFVAGLAGALIGYSRGQLSVDSFTVFVGLSLLAFAYLGGITSVGGAVIAGAFAPLGIGYVVLDRTIDVGDYYFLLGGLALILTARFNPQGIAGQTRRNLSWARDRLRGQRRGGREVTAAGQPATATPEVAARVP